MALQKVSWREFVNKGVLVIVFGCILLAGVMMCNSNKIHPPKPELEMESVNKYRIVTDNAQCWVVEYNEKGVKESIFHGNNLGECKMYLRNLNL